MLTLGYGVVILLMTFMVASEFDSDEGRKLVAAALAANEDFNSKRKEYIAMLTEDYKVPANFFLVGPLKSSLEDYMGSISLPP